MASSPPPSAAPTRESSVVTEPSALIAERLRQTRRYVKFIDLCTGIVTLLVGILAYLLLMALIDHWVVDLTPGLRFAALMVLLIGSAGFFVWRLLPALLYSVNPVYAAHAIEQAAPNLKNSLINLVLLAGQQRGVPDAIYNGLRQQAAGQLARVPPETMVDRGPLIRMGYLLVTLLALAALYKVLSPKDPLQSVARVAAPWKEIERPARIKISEVQPGDCEVYRGQTVDVTARIEGLDADEPASLLFATSDGRFIDRPIPLEPLAGQRFRGILTMGPRGVQQTLAYRIQAGDARTRDFQVVVRDAPHIDVQRATYQFPAYTQLAPRVVEGKGDLSAIEGTRVSIEALANQPIGSAYLELFAENPATHSTQEQPSQAVPMRVDGNRAVGQVTMLLRSDRTAPQAVAYQIRFATTDGHRNPQPTQYQIEVLPDLEPDVEILQPRQRDVELPANSRLAVEVRAFDPDFAVRQIKLLGAVKGTTKLTAILLDEPQSGQVVRTGYIVPQDLGLTDGDELIYWAEAHDNRQSPTGTPSPNVQRTANYRLRVVAADPNQTPGAAQDDEQPSEPNAQADQKDGPSDDSGEAGDQGSGSGQAGEEQGGSEQSDTDQGDAEDGGSEQGESQGAGNDESGAGESGSDQSGSAETGSEQAGGESGDAAEQSTEQGDAGADEDNNGGNGGDAEQGGSGDKGANGEDGRDGEPGVSRSGDQNRTGGNSAGGSDVNESQPVAPDGSNDSEAFERILRHMRESKGEPSDGAKGDEEGSSPSASELTEGDGERSPSEQSPDEGSDESSDGREVPSDSQSSGTEGRASPQTGDRQPTTSAERQEPTGADPQDGPSDGERSTDESTSGDKPKAKPGQNNQNAGDRAAAQDPTRTPPAGSDRSKSATEGGDASAESADEGSGSSAAQPPDPASRSTASGSDASKDEPTSGSSSDPAATAGDERQTPADDQGESSEGSGGTEADAGESSGAEGGAATQSGTGTPTENSNNSGTARPGAEASQAGETPGPSAGGPATSGQEAGPPEGPIEHTAAEEANIEYARRATDMALEHLQDQQNSSELSERLGWTQEEMQAFVRRWEQLQREAQQAGTPGQRARDRLEDQLRGLGLRPSAARLRSSQPSRGGDQQLREGGDRAPIPAEYLEQYRAFLKSVPRDATPSK